MRLKTSEIEAILKVFKEFSGHRKVEIFLFGSRVSDEKKGGDIDLLILVSKDERDYLVSKKFLISDGIQKLIGEQRIDMTFASPEQLETDVFLKSIFPKAILL